ncbi:hypothetical protein Indivirus_1_66 [Indivirus ILV1]|uniref:Minor capsid protein P11 C-terminal conserved region domain-containing protein n=1 Tax=Indivirus ILV1 TaxID=1977633 RepID=A0A1V0SCK1_9VIRU|nr:hypothetical protein Indivirus_1_66 [Indivirus ILV1]
MLNPQTKILLLVFAGLVLIYLLYNGRSEHYDNIVDGTADASRLQPVLQPATDVNPNETPKEPSLDSLANEDLTKKFSPEAAWLESKFDGRNKAPPGEYKVSDYAKGRRGNLGPSNWDSYFDSGNNVIGASQTGELDKFLPMDETNGEFAVFKTKGRSKCGSNQNCDPEELFDVDKYLPQEVNDSFFEVMPEPVSIKNRHLINITKPLGINTIGTSLKNASYDLRTEPANPKQVVSPWLQSSIEGNINLKPLF